MLLYVVKGIKLFFLSFTLLLVLLKGGINTKHVRVSQWLPQEGMRLRVRSSGQSTRSETPHSKLFHAQPLSLQVHIHVVEFVFVVKDERTVFTKEWSCSSINRKTFVKLFPSICHSSHICSLWEPSIGSFFSFFLFSPFLLICLGALENQATKTQELLFRNPIHGNL